MFDTTAKHIKREPIFMKGGNESIGITFPQHQQQKQRSYCYILKVK